jgi:hypothetical protein
VNKAVKLFKECLRRGLRAAKKLGCAEWCEKYVKLPEMGADPGKLKINKTPYMRELYDAVSDPRVHVITLMKCPQSGGSTWLFSAIQYLMATWGKIGMYVTSTKEMATKAAKEEIHPRILACKPLREMMTSDQDDFTNLVIRLKSAVLYLVGGQTPTTLASTPCPYVAVDESDKIKQANARETHAGELAYARTRFFKFIKKVLYVSTPTNVFGYIWLRFLMGDQRKYHCPCPHCGVAQELTFTKEKREIKAPAECRREDKSWDLDKVRELAYYECQSCHKGIPTSEKKEMIEKGKWVRTNLKASERERSYHVSELIVPNYSWGDTFAAFLQYKDQAGGLQKFYNEHLGLPYVEQAHEITDKEVDNVVETSLPKYKRKELPIKPVWVRMFVDTQTASKGFWWVHVAWDENGGLYVLDWGNTLGFDDLLVLYGRTYSFNGEQFQISGGVIDFGGDRGTEVNDFCIDSGFAFSPCQGRHVKHGMYQAVKYSTVLTQRGISFILFQFLDALFKNELYNVRIGRRSGKGFFLPQDIDQDMRDQLRGEREIIKNGNLEWTEVGPNHLGDCLKMALAWFRLAEVQHEEASNEIREENEKLKLAGEPAGSAGWSDIEYYSKTGRHRAA